MGPMGTNDRSEARLRSNNVLLALPGAERHGLPASFFGEELTLDALRATKPSLAGKTVYLCGDLDLALGLDFSDAARVFAVTEAPTPEGRAWTAIGPGRVPVDVHGVGVYYRRFFALDEPYFGRVCAEHAFQSLTESNKPGTAHRTGVYLTRVERAGDALRFRLLRCSTNLAGPTENFRATDAHIVDAVEREAAFVFDAHAPLNHVLAQVYRNTAATPELKQSKAKISSHSDKTKDMPRDGVMAFCTFYDRLDGLNPSKSDAYDYVHRGVSGLTRLRFRRKEGVVESAGSPPAEFSLTLYPGSVFFMPLSTNRLYGHVVKKKGRTEFLAFCRYLRSLHPPEVRIAIVLDNFSPHLSTKKDRRVGQWAAANNVELAYVPFYGSWLNRIEAQFTALRYFALDGTDHPSHEEQARMIRRYIAWRNRNANNRHLREVVNRANVA